MSMVNGAPVDSPSGSTIELIDLASAPQSSRPSLRISSAESGLSWHPKLTLYRLLVILSSVGLAAAKTATSYLNLTSASITLEWILGVAVFLFFHVLGAYEETNNPYFSWLFNFDCMEYLWACLRKLVGFNRPYYISDEIDIRHRVEIPPLFTGYRIIVTLVVATIGMSKSALLYGHKPTEATAVECVFGVGVATALYCLGLYEASSLKVYPKLFHVDYSSALYYTSETLIMETIIVFFHLLGILICSGLSYGVYLFTFSPQVAAKLEAMEIIPMLAMSILIGITSSLMVLGAAVTALALLYQLGWRYRASTLAQFIARLHGVRLIPYLHRKYWLPSGSTFLPRPRFFYLKRFIVRQAFKIPLNCFFLYMALMTLMYCVCMSLAMYPAFVGLKAGPWYLLIFSLLYIPFVGSLVAISVFTVRAIYKGVIAYFTEAWNDFSVEVERQGVVEAPLEDV
ncbi:hypothetical protein M413DRAFT_446112 [Hebeloma cylindrosporum]|uniref:Uncharacterized protein n=1 Tax=Hebeloma cylindrosporum TaxID=76867 RepID=A0A0C2YI43_HEBCY|nr:hypothetical protein M413DRAFT_446112 [Hebeloma cylindrosporum h7]